jgi:hypothetical protein
MKQAATWTAGVHVADDVLIVRHSKRCTMAGAEAECRSACLMTGP